jgi:hypothetical protein
MADWTMQRMMPAQIQMLGRDEILENEDMGYLTLLALSPTAATQ